MMARFKIIYSPEAIDDLRNTYSYIAVELLAPDIAEGQINRIRKAIRKLDFMPARHAIAEWEPWHSMNMHFLPVDNFVVYYLVDQDQMTVSIIRIFYSGRDVGTIINPTE